MNKKISPFCHKFLATDLRHEICLSWYPPGHGNFYESFVNSGLLEKFLKQGKKVSSLYNTTHKNAVMLMIQYVFLSNIDNLGATIDLQILNFMANNPKRPEFVMEVTVIFLLSRRRNEKQKRQERWQKVHQYMIPSQPSPLIYKKCFYLVSKNPGFPLLTTLSGSSSPQNFAKRTAILCHKK